WWTEHEKDIFIELPNGLDAVTIQTVFKAKGLQYPVVIFPITDKSIRTKAGGDRSWLNPGVEKIDKLKSFPFSLSSLKETSLSLAYEEEQTNQKLDNINLLYVALTRAKHRLFILANKHKAVKSKKAAENIYNSFKPSAMFGEYLSDKDRFMLEEGFYRFGENLHFPESELIKDSDFYYLEKFNGASWRNYLNLSNSSKFTDLEKEYSSQIWGVYVHEVMADIQNITDVPKALNRALYAGLIKPEDKIKIGDYINQIISHPVLGQFYKQNLKVVNEADIIDSFGQLYRPDRLVFLNNKTVVIDYKTGKASEKHKKQIREYAELLALMNYPEPESYLVYLQENIGLVKV
ncbi:MAG: hypothetical protein DRI74_05840, partial [Bacteroidetes bacterium]